VSERVKEKLPLFDSMVNSSVLPSDELRLTRQCKIMYRRLLRGPATNTELQKLTGSMNPTARRTDLRQELQKHGRDLVKLSSLDLPAGVNRYGITDTSGKVIAA
jgi:hypothetical protein